MAGYNHGFQIDSGYGVSFLVGDERVAPDSSPAAGAGSG
jgi:hypothetical protein